MLTTLLSILAASLAVLSAMLALWQLAVAYRFPIHRRQRWQPALGAAPGITMLKPIKGCDSATESCLRSWFEQDYSGARQLLIGVASLADPVVPLARRLIAEFPGCH